MGREEGVEAGGEEGSLVGDALVKEADHDTDVSEGANVRLGFHDRRSRRRRRIPLDLRVR